MMAFYAVGAEVLRGMDSARRAKLIRAQISTGRARLRISLDATAAPYLQVHVIETSGAKQRITDCYPKTDAQRDLCAAIAPLIVATVNNPERGEEPQAKLLKMLADRRHYLRVHADLMPASAPLITVTLREIGARVKGETVIALWEMEKVPETERPATAAMPESATVH